MLAASTLLRNGETCRMGGLGWGSIEAKRDPGDGVLDIFRCGAGDDARP